MTASTQPGFDKKRVTFCWSDLSNFPGGAFSNRFNPHFVYQSLPYVEYLAQTSNPALLDILSINRNDDKRACVGFVPVLTSYVHLKFIMNSSTKTQFRFQSAIILGGDPMICQDSVAYDSLFRELAYRYTHYRSISLGYVCQESLLWDHISNSDFLRKRFLVYVTQGFAECHKVRIPVSIDVYRDSLSKKKRYNLARQERLVETSLSGKLRLFPIETTTDLPLLQAAIKVFKGCVNDDSTLSPEQYKIACDKNLVLCYVLMIDHTIAGLVFGTKSREVYLVHKLYYLEALRKYSIGTTLWQMVLRDLIGRKTFTMVDMGYGSPTYRYSATNTLEKRGHVLLMKKSVLNYILISTHRLFNFMKLQLKPSQDGPADKSGDTHRPDNRR